MFRRTICIFLTLVIVLGVFAGCNSKDTSSEQQETESYSSVVSEEEKPQYTIDDGGNIVDEEGNVLSKEEYSINDKGEVVSSQGKVVGTTSSNKANSTTSSSTKESSKTNNTTGSSTSNKSDNKTNNQNSNQTNSTSSTSSQSEKLVINTSNTIYKGYPSLTNSYIYPSESKTNFTKNSSNVYENEYVKVDASHGKDGYLLITYKDPWAERVWIVLDETNAFNGYYEKTHHFYYNKGDFRQGEPIAVSLPKTDAIYYLVISSCINGKEANKLLIDLGRITKSGTVSFSDMLPTEEQIKLTQTSSGIYANKYVKINTNTASNGYVEIEYIEPNGFDIEVSVSSNTKNQLGNHTSWNYRTSNKGKCKIKAALTYGNSEYVITVGSTMKNTSLNAIFFSKKAELTVTLSNVSNTAGFLLSTGEVIYDSNMMFIKKASEISATCKNDFEKVSKIYDWLTSYLNYKVTEDTPLGQYKCDLNKVYNRKTGVCYDYAVVLAAMLRSQGIPCKVVFGKYSDSSSGEGHAWNEVYIPSNGSITSDKLSITGNKWCRLDPTMSHSSSGKVAIDFMNNAKNYVWYSYY